MKRQIVNIINFVRACEPRSDTDLITPIQEQIRLMQKHSLKGTFLLQYDAMISDDILKIFKDIDQEQFELGVWYEVVQPLVEDCGMVWRGRYPWDWHTSCGFPVGYSKTERKLLIDALYRKFKSLFGYYPRVFGSWLFDSYTACYISDTYGADAYCNCREQYGTDGYTLWGGYYGQGYYPSRNNVFMPAIDLKNQLPVPLFRMLGSDPVYQYDIEIDVQREKVGAQNVVTLEPVFTGYGGGGFPKWVDWYMKENFNGECLSFGYAQAGQENSFGWPAMKDGLIYQFALFEKLRDEGKIEIEPLGETGRWYKETYRQTPASTIVAHTAFDDPDKNSVWYCTKQYRINLYAENDVMRIRDLHIYSDKSADPYEDILCTESCAYYEALPVVDGNRYTGKGVRAGAYIKYIDGTTPDYGKMEFCETGNGTAVVTYGEIIVALYEDTVKITAPKPFTLENRIGIDGYHLPKFKNIVGNRINLTYGNVDYSVVVKHGTVLEKTLLASENGLLELVFEA